MADQGRLAVLACEEVEEVACERIYSRLGIRDAAPDRSKSDEFADSLF